MSSTVSEYGIGVHENFQLNFNDASHRPLVGMSSVLDSNAARLPAKILGGHQRAPGEKSYKLL